MNSKKILGVILIAGALMFMYYKRNKSKDVSQTPARPLPVNPVIPETQEVKNVNNTPAPAVPVPQNIDPVLNRAVVVPPLPTKYADGSPVPKSVLDDPEYIKAWNQFYKNTIFPPGDPRNTPTPSGGMLIGDGNGGFYDPTLV